jgi:hypothetical protein
MIPETGKTKYRSWHLVSFLLHHDTVEDTTW